MRFALIATSAAAVAAAPFAAALIGPQMSPDQFLSAVRCTAYEGAVGEGARAEQWRLNTEARRQAPDTTVEARAEARQIARQAQNVRSDADAASLRAAACGDRQIALDAEDGNAV
jgi:hypothetical protein